MSFVNTEEKVKQCDLSVKIMGESRESYRNHFSLVFESPFGICMDLLELFLGVCDLKTSRNDNVKKRTKQKHYVSSGGNKMLHNGTPTSTPVGIKQRICRLVWLNEMVFIYS